LSKDRKAFATIISEFLRNKGNGTVGLRYLFKGFEFGLVEEVSKNMEKDFLVKIPVISLDQDYQRAIKSRASNEPLFIWVSTREASEYSSLSSTFKCVSNVFYPFQKEWERVEGVYDLFDITEWLFREDKLACTAQKFLGSAEYSAKKKSLENTLIVLRNLWDVAERSPSLKNRLSPISIAEILTSIHSSKQLSFNDLVQIIGLEPCISIRDDQEGIDEFFISSRKIMFLSKGSDTDKRGKLAKLCENCLAGVLLFFLSISKTPGMMIPKDLDIVRQLFKGKDEKGRRVWIVSSPYVEIKEYSLNSGVAKRVSFSLRNRKTKKPHMFEDAWNLIATKEELPLFLEFLRGKNIVSHPYLIDSPLKLEVRKDEVELTFSYLEGYLFSRGNFRGEIDEI